MKQTTIIAALTLLSLASCTKQHDYLCTITETTPEGIVYQVTTVQPFRGTNHNMMLFQAANTYTAPDSSHWQTCVCK